MNIKEVLEMPIGQKFGGFDVVIKTCKKKWELKGVWTQQAILFDNTGDILADVNIGKNIPLNRGSVLHITVGEVQQGVIEVGDNSIKKIYIDQFVLPATIGEPAEAMEFFYDANQVVRSKVKCWLVSAVLQAGGEVDKDKIDELVDYVME
jgi:hypothetical protein